MKAETVAFLSRYFLRQLLARACKETKYMVFDTEGCEGLDACRDSQDITMATVPVFDTLHVITLCMIQFWQARV